MGIVFKNNAKTTLASSLSNSATSATVTDGGVFPTLGAGEFFLITFDDGVNNEICKCTARSSNTLTIVRAQDNTSARAFSSGDAAEGRVTAGVLETIQENIAAKSADQTVYNATTASSATAYDIGIDPGVEANAMVFLDGVMQHHDTFSFSGSTLTFDAAPTDGTKLEVIVDNLINLQSSNLTVDSFTAADVGGSAQTAFTLSDTPAAETNLIVFVEGVFQDQDAYTISSSTLTITTGVIAGRGVTVYVINPVNIGTPSDGTITSAKLSGNLTLPGTLTVGANDVAFDSPTFVVDNSNSRVGLGTASPTVPVDIVGETKMSSHLTLGTTSKVQFGDSGTYIHQSADGVLDLVADTEIEINATTIDVNGNLDVSGTIVSAGKITADAGIDIDNINIDGTTIALSSGDLLLDVAGEINLDADGGKVRFKDAGTEIGRIVLDNSQDLEIVSSVSDKDIKFKGSDASSNITALTLDMSEAGAAIFNGKITADAGIDIDNFNIDGTTIALSSGDLLLDVAGMISLNADNAGTVIFEDATLQYLVVENSSSDAVFRAGVQNKDILFKGNDNGTGITALTLDMSEAGAANFNSTISLSGVTSRTLGGVTGSHGTLQVSGSGASGYEGLSIDGRVVVMHDGGNVFGIYNDVDGEWLFRADRGGATNLYHDGTAHFSTVSAGVTTTARMGFMGSAPSSDITCHAGSAGGTSTQWRWGSNTSNTYAYFIDNNNAGVAMASGAQAWSGHSDERIKENITDIGSVLNKVKDYRCVEFNRKTQTRKMYGFIAQDWETDFPYCVDEDTGFTIQSDGSLKGVNEEGNTSTVVPKTISYTETIPVLLKAIQEQQTIIEDLKARIETLEG